MRPDALARLGLDAASTRATRPGLIHCTITGFGPGGPYRGMPAYDLVVQGASGIAGLFALRDGAPIYVPLVLCDHVVGEIAAGAVMAALVERSRTGEGDAIEVPMLETMAAFVLHEHLGGGSFEPPIAPAGDRRLLSAGSAPLRTADGWISLTANTDAQCRALLGALGREDLLDDPRFGSVAARMRHIDDWLQLRREAMLTRTTTQWLDALARLDVPAMPCHSLESLLDDPHLRAVGLLGSHRHPTEGAVRSVRPTILHDGAPAEPGAPAGPIGWDTRAVLVELGLEGRDVDALVADAVVVDGRPTPCQASDGAVTEPVADGVPI